MIEISNLTKCLDKKPVISDLSFSTQKHECVGLFGEDHMGKTELLNLISSSTMPTNGRIKIQGFDTQTETLKARKKIGYQLSRELHHPRMSVREFLSFIATVRGFHGTEKRTRVEQIVMKLELFAILDAPLSALSTGLKRKVALAQALMHDPAVLLLDEPTQGLAPDQAPIFRALIRSLTQEMTVIIASRNNEELAELCTRALIISGGRLVADTPVLDLQRESRHFQAVTLSADTPLDLLALAVLPGVAGIEEHQHAPGTVTVLTMPGHAIYPHINTLIANRGWKINALHVEPGRLNDVIHTLSQEASL